MLAPVRCLSACSENFGAPAALASLANGLAVERGRGERSERRTEKERDGGIRIEGQNMPN